MRGKEISDDLIYFSNSNSYLNLKNSASIWFFERMWIIRNFQESEASFNSQYLEKQMTVEFFQKVTRHDMCSKNSDKKSRSGRLL